MNTSASSPTWSSPTHAATNSELFNQAYTFYLTYIRSLASSYANPFTPRRRRFYSMDEGMQAARLAIWSAITSWKPGSRLTLGEWIKLSFHNRLRCPHRSDTSFRYTPASRAATTPRIYLTFEDTPATDLTTPPDTGDTRQFLSHLVSNLSLSASRVLESMPGIWAERKGTLSPYYIKQSCAFIGIADVSVIKAIAAEFADLKHRSLSTEF